MSALFDPIFGAADVAPAVSDRAWVEALLDVEAALTLAASDVGIVHESDAVVVTDAVAALRDSDGIDIGELGRASSAGGNPVIALVTLIRAQATSAPASAVHPGATSQDVLDTALVLILRRAGAVAVTHGHDAVASALALAQRHRDTPMAARTLGQQALPTTFGAVAAGWALALHRAATALDSALSRLTVQFGGAAGTLAAVHPHGPAMADAFADRLGLPRQLNPWHTDRTSLLEVMCAFGVLAAAVGKPATDITLLAATEVGEVTEGASGGSSAMPHKQNPVAAITARAAAARVPALVSTMLTAGTHEHQRAAGAWHTEWETATSIVRCTAGAAHRLADSLGGLVVHPDAMARNLQITRGALLSERVAGALAPYTDRARAIVTDAILSGRALDADPAVLEHLSPDRVRELLDPAGYSGHAGDLVDRAAAHITSSKGHP